MLHVFRQGWGFKPLSKEQEFAQKRQFCWESTHGTVVVVLIVVEVVVTTLHTLHVLLQGCGFWLASREQKFVQKAQLVWESTHWLDVEAAVVVARVVVIVEPWIVVGAEHKLQESLQAWENKIPPIKTFKLQYLKPVVET
jgi:hypothetical protein